MRTLLAEGVDLRGYFHWTLADNFEWNEGWHLRFGLFELDPITQTRTARPSAQHYAQLIRESMGRRGKAMTHGAKLLATEEITAGDLAPQTAGANGIGAHTNGNGRSAELPSRVVAENESGFSK
jgi:beta-glucosidase